MSETNTPVFSVEPDGTFVFHYPIKIGDIEIEPTHGGVLKDGDPYQAEESLDLPLSKNFRWVPVTAPDSWVIGSSPLAVTINLADASRFAFIVEPLGNTQVQPVPVTVVTSYNVVVTVNGVSNIGTFADRIFTYNNYYNGEYALVNINSVTPIGPTSATVDLNVDFSAFMYNTTAWIDPGDAMFFMEFV